MLLIEADRLSVGGFLAVSDTMAYRKAQWWLLVPYVRLSRMCRICVYV